MKTDKHGLYKDNPSAIAVYGGGTIDPLNPSPSDIDIEVIAHSLAMQCRWTGHTTRFYSVAEHCVLVSKINPTLEALLHDASEAYLSDLARPIKHAPGLGVAYAEVEAKLEKAVAERFDLTYPWPKAVKNADDFMLRREAEEIVPHLGAVMQASPKSTPRVRCWTPAEAEMYFLDRYYTLEERRNGRR